MLKKISIIVTILLMAIILVACGNESGQVNSNSDSQDTKQNDTLLSKDEFKQMFSDPDKFKGRKVDYYAKIFTEPEKDANGTYIQAFADPDNSTQNTLIQISDPNLDVKNDDIIHIVGTIEKKYDGENAFGGSISAPVIVASKIEKSDYATAFDPAIKTIDVNKEIDQHGYVIKLNKVEFGTENTRAYLTITNNTNGNVMFSTYDSKATQGNKQFDKGDSYGKYPELNTEILSGIKEEGVVVFKPLDANGESVKFIFEGHSSSDYSLEFEPYTFEVNMQ
ncbi:hypothetical protein [Clostridium kluyveri]|jgi:hypothetical protein|uniref:DUF4352 domain-containing protein n=1 Tax=Clostridium kluyveri (strain ATCC 8527 / DSM 555 / NBRC 12016 / NCIMB 10680 / K1) TaxID=431943 RepID=A5N9B2_CLOK5|nr:hypothetical protein [Clostridium kluyveri]EDK33893.1 Conserved hypothetical protein [Clostridium kluyveri DSM 555]